MRRLVVTGAALGLTVIGAGAAVTATAGRDGTAEAAATNGAVATATVARRDLVLRDDVDGTLGYGEARTVVASAPGTVTRLPEPGTVVTRGGSLYDVDARAFFGGAALPRFSDRIGGRCGGGDMYRTAWSADGTRVLYTFNDGDTGANGVWAWDVASGEQHVIHSYASSPAGGPGELVMFGAGAFVMYGSSDGGYPRVITDGTSPAWWVSLGAPRATTCTFRISAAAP